MGEKNSPEMDLGQEAIDRLLRRSLAAPLPSLPPDFDQRVLSVVRRGSRPLKRSGKILLIAYGFLSAAVSVTVMRGQGLGWVVIAGMILASLALIAVAHSAVAAVAASTRHSK